MLWIGRLCVQRLPWRCTLAVPVLGPPLPCCPELIIRHDAAATASVSISGAKQYKCAAALVVCRWPRRLSVGACSSAWRPASRCACLPADSSDTVLLMCSPVRAICHTALGHHWVLLQRNTQLHRLLEYSMLTQHRPASLQCCSCTSDAICCTQFAMALSGGLMLQGPAQIVTRRCVAGCAQQDSSGR